MNFNATLKNLIFSISKPVVDSIFPPVCFLCDSFLKSQRKVVCEKCWSKLKTLSLEELNKINKAIIKDNYDNINILYDFTEELQNIIHLLKYERCFTLAYYFAQDILTNYKDQFFNNYDIIIPVPLHKVKLRERGYNQSFEIIKHLPADYSNNFLSRNIYTKSQTTLSRNERILNVANAFECKKQIKNMRILLFDDILTTGSTLNECAKVLNKNGAVSVDVLCLAAPLKHA